MGRRYHPSGWWTRAVLRRSTPLLGTLPKLTNLTSKYISNHTILSLTVENFWLLWRKACEELHRSAVAMVKRSMKPRVPPSRLQVIVSRSINPQPVPLDHLSHPFA